MRHALSLALVVVLGMPISVASGVALAGCQVSAFGGEPVTIIGTSTGSGGSAGQACSEPDDARRAREDAESCGERCRIEDGAIVGECEAVVVEDGVATIDLSDADGLIVRLEICEPSGTSFELGDSRTLAASSHDARIVLEGTTMTVHASVGSGVPDSRVTGWVAAEGCTTRTISLSEQLVYFAETEAGLCGTGMLRINPPTDDEGSPDARWYLALGRALEGDATGTGVRSVDLCLW